MSQPIFVVDAFTDEQFKGNPAAVVPLIERQTDQWMQSVAAEMNLSETAFVDVSSASGIKCLRWFTPTTEVDLCGHATLATTHVLGGSQEYDTRSGKLRCHANGDGWIEMNFPADPPKAGAGVDWTGVLPGSEVISDGRGKSDPLAQLGNAEEVRRLRPNWDAIAELPGRGLIVTAPADIEGIDFVSRCFYPTVGVNEDPVTGSAHCTLAMWWSERLGKTELVGQQVSRRGGRVRMRVESDRVFLSGQAVTVLEGQLHVR